VRAYYNDFRKTDWRNASQFLALHCADSLRLYYLPGGERAMLYYNPALFSQASEWWRNVLASNPSVEELAAALPHEYDNVCLVISHVIDPLQQNTLETALQKRFSQQTTVDFFQVKIEMYQR
jgi:hypothetical protein